MSTQPADHAVREIRRALLAWYREVARDLPWRRTCDPYHIWLSEVLLQQTRVETVVPYYERFLREFPTVAALADAPLDKLMKCWEGLGYYTRARNLQRAARNVVQVRGGEFPATADEWQQLPGIGRYTAGAIASIANNEPVPAVDGNVKRVLARLFAIERSIDTPATEAELWALAERLLSRRSPGAFNQALMELGARICTPRAPACERCPLAPHCAARAAGKQAALPIRRTKRPVPHVEAAAAVICDNGRYLLLRRPPTGLLGGLWTWPAAEVVGDEQPADALRIYLREVLDVEAEVGQLLATVRHEFTHRRLRLHAFACRILAGHPRSGAHGTVRRVPRSRLDQYALATADRKVLAKLTTATDLRQKGT